MIFKGYAVLELIYLFSGRNFLENKGGHAQNKRCCLSGLFQPALDSYSTMTIFRSA